MSKSEIAIDCFGIYNCAQAVLSAYAADYGLEKDKALQLAVGFGGGIGRLQAVCGAVSGAVMILGLASNYKEGDKREKMDAVYGKVRSLISDFAANAGAINCRDLLGCDLNTEEGKMFFKEHNRRNNCRSYVVLCCELLDKYLSEA